MVAREDVAGFELDNVGFVLLNYLRALNVPRFATNSDGWGLKVQRLIRHSDEARETRKEAKQEPVGVNITRLGHFDVPQLAGYSDRE